MASRRHLIVMALLMIVSSLLSFGCAAHKPQLSETPEQKAVRIAREYVRTNAKDNFAETDHYAATPYEGGWMVRISREISKKVDGTPVYDPGDPRFVKVDTDGKVVEYFPGSKTVGD